jgi:hypothetical protein
MYASAFFSSGIRDAPIQAGNALFRSGLALPAENLCGQKFPRCGLDRVPVRQPYRTNQSKPFTAVALD